MFKPILILILIVFCVALRALILRDNQLNSMPAELDKFAHLHRLDLSDNQLGQIDDVLGNMHMLVELMFYNNEIKTLPSRYDQTLETI